MKSFSRWKTFNFCDAPSLSVASVSRREGVKVTVRIILVSARKTDGKWHSFFLHGRRLINRLKDFFPAGDVSLDGRTYI